MDQSPSRPWLALQVTLGVQIAASLLLAAVPILAPVVAPQLGFAPGRVGVFMSVVYLCAMFASAGCGPLVARLGATGLMPYLIASMGVGALAIATGHMVMMLLAAALIGAAYGCTYPAGTATLGRHAPVSSPGLFFAMKQSGVPLGVALAGMLVPIGLVMFGWRGTFGAVAAVCLLLALAVQVAVPRLDDRSQRSGAATGVGLLRSLVLVLRNPGLRRLSLMGMTFAMAQQAFLIFSVTLLTVQLGLSLPLAAGLLAASQVVAVFVRILCGHAADRWIAPQVLLGSLGITMAASCVLLGLLPQDPALPLAALAMLACGATTMGWNGVFYGQLLRIVPRSQLAESAGSTSFFIFAGNMAGPFLFSEFLRLGGSYAAGYACLGVMAALAGLAMLRPLPQGAAGPQPAAEP